MKKPLAFLLMLAAAPAGAVSITEVGGAGGGAPMAADPSAFVGSGACGSGGSVINDGCSVVVKNAESPRPAGRFDPFGDSCIDSQDRAELVWTVRSDTPFQNVRFALTDAFDQPDETRWGGASHFSMTVGDAVWTIASQEADGTLHWLDVLLDAPTTEVEIGFHTRLNDGFGVRQARLAPIPLPAGGFLVAVGAGSLMAMRRRRA
jgi:hypothetical protein